MTLSPRSCRRDAVISECDIKALVKSVLGMTRVPRNLGAIWCFYYAWKVGHGAYVPDAKLRLLGFNQDHRDTYFNALIAEFNTHHTESSPTDTISVTLTEPSPSRPTISVTLTEPSPSSPTISGILRNYTPGYRCRVIKSWTPAAQVLFNKFVELNITIPKSHWERLGDKVETVSTDLIPYLQPSHTTYYRNTPASPFRLYHELQNMPKEERNVLFSGCLDLDIVSCFGSIWWHELDGHRTGLELLHPQNSHMLKCQLACWFPGKSDKQLKAKRSTLFSGRLTYPPVTPFDALQAQVAEHVGDFIGDKYVNHHKLYTQVESGLMNRLYATAQPLLKIHDGAIFNQGTQIDSDILSPHSIKTCIL